MSRFTAPAVAGVAFLAILVEALRTNPNGYVILAAIIIFAVALVWLGDHPEEEQR